MKKLLSTFFMLMLVFIVKAQLWQTPQEIRVIPNVNLPDIAIATYDMNGPVIYINPITMNKVGRETEAFFMAHEYGHHFLGHIINRLFNGNDTYMQVWLDLNMENEADRYAVDYWVDKDEIDVIRAWVNTMWAINNPGDRTHEPSRNRANNVVQYYFEITGAELFGSSNINKLYYKNPEELVVKATNSSTCSTIQEIINYAGSNFEEIKSDLLIEEDGCKIYKSTVSYGINTKLEKCDDPNFTLSFDIYNGIQKSIADKEFQKWEELLDKCLMSFEKTSKESNLYTKQIKYYKLDFYFQLYRKDVFGKIGIFLDVKKRLN